MCWTTFLMGGGRQRRWMFQKWVRESLTFSLRGTCWGNCFWLQFVICIVICFFFSGRWGREYCLKHLWLRNSVILFIFFPFFFFCLYWNFFLIFNFLYCSGFCHTLKWNRKMPFWIIYLLGKTQHSSIK